MFDHSDPLGARVNVLNNCALFLVEAISTQATGSRQYTAPSSRITVGSAAVRRSAPCLPRRRASGAADGASVSAPSVLVSAIAAHRPWKMRLLLARSRKYEPTNMTTAMITDRAAAS